MGGGMLGYPLQGPRGIQMDLDRHLTNSEASIFVDSSSCDEPLQYVKSFTSGLLSNDQYQHT